MFFSKTNSKLENNRDGIRQAKILLEEATDKQMENLKEDIKAELDELSVPEDEREEYIANVRKEIRSELVKLFKKNLIKKVNPEELEESTYLSDESVQVAKKRMT